MLGFQHTIITCMIKPFLFKHFFTATTKLNILSTKCEGINSHCTQQLPQFGMRQELLVDRHPKRIVLLQIQSDSLDLDYSIELSCT